MKVAVVGTGAVFEERHGPALAQAAMEGRIEIVGLCDMDRERRALFSPWRLGHHQWHGEPNDNWLWKGPVFSGWQKMVDEQKPDAAMLFLPPWAHGPIELGLCEMGIPFLVEKPLGVDIATPKTISEAVEKKGLVTSSGFLERYGTHASWLRRFLEARTMRHVNIGDYNPTNVRGRWTTSRKLSRSFHIEHVIHQLDLIRYFGDEPVKVASFESIREPIEGNDMPWAYATIYQLKGGGTVSIQDVRTLNWDKLSQRWQEIELVDCSIKYTTERVTVDGVEQWNSGATGMQTLGFNNLFLKEHASFFHAIEANDPGMVRSNYRDALQSFACMLAAVESAERGGEMVDIVEWSGLALPPLPTPYNKWDAWSTPRGVPEIRE